MTFITLHSAYGGREIDINIDLAEAFFSGSEGTLIFFASDAGPESSAIEVTESLADIRAMIHAIQEKTQ